MLKNDYLVAKIGVDTAENELFQVEPARTGRDAAVHRRRIHRHDTSLFPRLVLGCINADFGLQIIIFQHFSRSTVAPIGRKKSASTFLLPKKNTFGGEPPSGAP